MCDAFVAAVTLELRPYKLVKGALDREKETKEVSVRGGDREGAVTG